ncbi:MAG: histidine ammonia-lyase [Calditrichia bacterium]
MADTESGHIVLNGNNLNLQTVIPAARSTNAHFTLSEEAVEKIRKSRAWVDKIRQTGEPVVYGVNTGFGSKATVSISKENLEELQRNLIMSHSAGVGDPLPIDVVRTAMILRANTLAKGFSGIRQKVVETLLAMINRNVTPWIPEQGSVGASGDLAPLSHLALVLSRDPRHDSPEHSGKAYYFHQDVEEWELLPGWEAMKFAGIPRVVLEAKEGLALNNGTQISTAILATTLYDAIELVKQADIAMALTLEALEGISSAFREELHLLRPHPGQIQTAENIRRLTAGSHLLDRKPEKVQDAYSLRCHPQVLAGVRDIIGFIKDVVEREMNATNDNPIILPDIPEENKAISGGNFHAQPIAFTADYLAIALSEVGSIAERRIARMSDKNLNGGLPSFLIPNSGLASGLMIAQYTAAAIASENKSLAHPASVDSLPTCENQEDHVSMAPIAARKAKKILENVQKIVAIEMLYAAQAIDLRKRDFHSGEEILGAGSRIAYELIRSRVEFMEADRPVYEDIQKMLNLVKSGAILRAVEKELGELN